MQSIADLTWCADIRFSSQATLLSRAQCQNSLGLYISLIKPKTNKSISASETLGTNGKLSDVILAYSFTAALAVVAEVAFFDLGFCVTCR